MKKEMISDLRIGISFIEEKISKLQIKREILKNKNRKYNDFIKKVKGEEEKLLKYNKGIEVGLELFTLEDNFNSKTVYPITNDEQAEKARSLILRTLNQLNAHKKKIENESQNIDKQILRFSEKVKTIEKNIFQSVSSISASGKSASKLLLPPGEKEKLEEQIIEEVEKRYFEGEKYFNGIFRELSEDAQNLFGFPLTFNQIKGRYQRAPSSKKSIRRT